MQYSLTAPKTTASKVIIVNIPPDHESAQVTPAMSASSYIFTLVKCVRNYCEAGDHVTDSTELNGWRRKKERKCRRWWWFWRCVALPMSRQTLVNKSMKRSHKQVVKESLLRAALYLIG